MDKKGQVTVYVVLGIVVVAVTFLLLFLKTNIFLFNPSQEDLEGEFDDISAHITNCLKEVSDEPLRRIGRQGGYLAPASGTYRLFNDTQVSYLCYDMAGSPLCMNRMLTKNSMEGGVEENVDYMLRTCLNVQGFKKFGGFDIIEGGWSTDVDVRKENVIVNLNYPIT